MDVLTSAAFGATRDAPRMSRPPPAHGCAPNWPLPGPTGAYDDFGDIALVPMDPTSFDGLARTIIAPQPESSGDDASSSHLLLQGEPQSRGSATSTYIIRFQSPPRSPSPPSPAAAPAHLGVGLELTSRPPDHPFGKREIFATLLAGAACGTVTGVFSGSMLGSLWGAQSEAESLRTAAPAGLGLGLLIGCMVATVKRRYARRRVVPSPV